MNARLPRWVSLAQPVGVRSCRDFQGGVGEGGSWQWVGHPHAVIHDLRVMAGGLTDLEFTMLRAELKGRMGRAARGELNLQRGVDRAEVVQCRRQERVLELRLEDRQERPPGCERWKVRFYYSEPAHERGVLLALSVKAKVGGQSGLDDQNRHMDEASRRLDAHYE